MVRKLSKPSATRSGAGRSFFILVRSSSEVPQGSLLGPLFFAIFISDLPEVVLPGNTIALYADDCKSTRIIDSASDQSLFQEDLNNLHQWSSRNFVDFNVKKCKIMRITKKKQPLTPNFFLDNSVWRKSMNTCIVWSGIEYGFRGNYGICCFNSTVN